MENSIRLSLKPKGDQIEMIETKGSDFLRSHGFSDDVVEVQTMIIRELIENAIKYGNFTRRENRVTVHIRIEERLITIEVMNPVDGSASEHLKILDKTIRWIRGYQDPFEPFSEKLKEVSEGPPGEEGAGLGLTKIAYEGKATLDFFVSEENILNVSAITTLNNN